MDLAPDATVRWRGDVDGGWVARQRIELQADPSSCAVARRMVEQMQEALPTSLVRDLLLVADELVTQALLVGHLDPARDMIIFELDAGRFDVTLAVEDPTDAFRPRPPTRREEQGLGLVIIERIADRWGIERVGHVTRTWASFAVPTSQNADVGVDARSEPSPG
ncbi:MAG TPA: ATP-binding protein [Actinomycetota bacterium]|nr:ATP-binding protein [Actinomycetota bacterium]